MARYDCRCCVLEEDSWLDVRLGHVNMGSCTFPVRAEVFKKRGWGDTDFLMTMLFA